MNIKSYLSFRPQLSGFYIAFLAFFTYLFFYPFRRAYTAASYENVVFFNVNFKILMITAQVLGFAVSKRIGVKLVSEMQSQHRARNLFFMVLLATIFYALFAITPAPYSLLFIFLANLPLGMFYGTILGFLEGRKITEFLVAILTASFIVGSGFAKSIGLWVLDFFKISEYQIPVMASLLMLLPIGLLLYFMNQIPSPTASDISSRVERKPMYSKDRKEFVSSFSLGLILFILSYVILTALREFRDNFTPEIWTEFGINDKKIFTQTEILIAISVMIIMVSFNWIKNNYKAFFIIEIAMLAGSVFVLMSTFMFQMGFLSPFWWLTLLGFGIYISYAMSNSLYFERMIAAFQKSGTVGFLITLADYYAYFGTIIVLFIKNYYKSQFSHINFMITISYVIGIMYFIMISISIWYFRRRKDEVIGGKFLI